jgi:SAM-dependent methyltransferase
VSLSSDKWVAGDAYDRFMGRWSRKVAEQFLEWLDPAPRAHWLEVGCGTGALTEAICGSAQPSSIVACDPSPGFISFAESRLGRCPATFLVVDADDLPRREGGFDFVVSGLVLNFLVQPAIAVGSMRQRTRIGGKVAAYVWDYSEGMEFLRVFWEEAIELDPSASHLAERHRFPFCRPDPLTELFAQAGLADVEVRPFEFPFIFHDFHDYWAPFLGGTGPAPSYVASLDTQGRTALMNRLKKRLVPASDGTIRLGARAFGVSGLVANRQ